MTHNDYILYICIWTTRKAINTLIVCLFKLGNVNEQIELKLIDARFVSIKKQMLQLENLYFSNRKTFDLLCLTKKVVRLFQYTTNCRLRENSHCNYSGNCQTIKLKLNLDFALRAGNATENDASCDSMSDRYHTPLTPPPLDTTSLDSGHVHAALRWRLDTLEKSA